MIMRHFRCRRPFIDVHDMVVSAIIIIHISVYDGIIIIDVIWVVTVRVSPARRRCDVIITIDRRTLQPHIVVIINDRRRLGGDNQILIVRRRVQAKHQRRELLVCRKRIPLILKLIHRKDSVNRVVINHAQIKLDLDSLHCSRLDLDFFLSIKMIDIRLHQDDEFAFICLRTNVFHIKIKLNEVIVIGGVKLHFRLGDHKQLRLVKSLGFNLRNCRQHTHHADYQQ